MMKNKKGITLIALVITIIVLLLLAGISVSMLSGDNSILTKAGEARDITAEKTVEERIQIAYIAALTNGNGVITPNLLEAELTKEFGEKNTAYTIQDSGTAWEIEVIGTNVTKTITKPSYLQGNTEVSDLQRLTNYFLPGTRTITEVIGEEGWKHIDGENMADEKIIQQVQELVEVGKLVIKYKNDYYKVTYNSENFVFTGVELYTSSDEVLEYLITTNGVFIDEEFNDEERLHIKKYEYNNKTYKLKYTVDKTEEHLISIEEVSQN